MSLETAIHHNTDALHVLIDLIKSAGVPAPLVSAAKDVIVKAPKAESEAQKPVAPEPKAEVAQPVKASVSYEDIRTPFLELVNKKGREAAQQLLNDLGIPTGSKLSALAEGDYPKALELIKKAIG